MKKILSILLFAALALPAMAQLTATKGQAAPRPTDRDAAVTAMNPLKPFTGIIQATKTTRADDGVVYECGFETDEELAQWTVIDADGDGKNWGQENTSLAHTGSNALVSYSYQGGALTPDNWAISPSVPLGGTLTIWAENYMSSYPDKFAVYVCVGDPSDLNNFVKVSDDITPPTTWTQYDIDLGAYSGQEGVFALRHYDCVDQFKIFIDDISLSAPKAAMPQNVTVVPAATSADVTWENEGNVAWNLRYRPYTPMPETFWDFENGTLEPWTTIDSDGDGYEWHLWDPNSLGYDPGDGVQLHGTMCATSASYQGTALTPDNWLISPQVTIDGPLSFWAGGQDPSYAAEVFAVYVCVGDPSDLNNFVKISEDITAESPIKQYTFDLADYQGQEGYVAFRHYGVTDMFRLNIDDIMIGEWAGEAEWIYVNDIDEMEYTIDGLTPETEYEVQVQGNDGKETKNLSSWTESVIFTTLAEGQEEPVYYVVGFNDWSNPIEIGEEGATVTVAAQDFENSEDTAQEFKVITYDADGATVWFGGADDNGVGYFEITEELLGGEISLDTPGANFRLPEAGTYNIKLIEVAAELPVKDPVETLKMIVTKESTTAIETIKSDVKGDNNYYNLMGQKVSGNLPAGIYIHNGKKIVVR